MNAFKQQCIELRRLDYTLLQISKITNRPKNSVYFHIKDIPLSPDKQSLIRSARIQRISILSAARKGNSKRQFKKFTRWDKSLVDLVSHLIFDGEIKQSGCIYNNRNNALLNKVESLMSRLYEFRPKKHSDPITGVGRISYFNVALAKYMKEKSAELIKEIVCWSKLLKREFLRAFFDDEGCVDFKLHSHTRRLRGYQKDISVLVLVQKLLNDFGIVSVVYEPNEIVITGKTNLEKFQKEINFSSKVFINGRRSNSVWKKSLEKRWLLDQAIKSFKS